MLLVFNFYSQFYLALNKFCIGSFPCSFQIHFNITFFFIWLAEFVTIKKCLYFFVGKKKNPTLSKKKLTHKILKSIF